MFHKYSEKTSKAIYQSRWEAGEYGAAAIGTEHLLLGLLREDKVLIRHFFPKEDPIRLIRELLEQYKSKNERVSKSEDIPLSREYQNVLEHAANEAKELGTGSITTEYLLLGMLRNADCVAAKILTEMGLDYSTVRKQLENEGTRL